MIRWWTRVTLTAVMLSTLVGCSTNTATNGLSGPSEIPQELSTKEDQEPVESPILSASPTTTLGTETETSHRAIGREQKSEVNELLQNGSQVSVENPIAPIDWNSVTSAPRKFAGLDALHRGPISVEVRLAEPAELRDVNFVTEGEILTALFGSLILVGAGLGAAGVTVAVPALAGPALKAGITIAAVIPGGTAIAGLEGHRRSVLAESVAKADFPRLTQTALQRRLRAAEAPLDESPERRVGVVILGYGFVRGPQADSACSFLHALIRLDLPGHDTQEDWVFIEPSRHSDDAPPSYCTPAKKFIANDGELARQTWTENSEILAAIVARRLEEKR